MNWEQTEQVGYHIGWFLEEVIWETKPILASVCLKSMDPQWPPLM